jgi:hypothetical protein
MNKEKVLVFIRWKPEYYNVDAIHCDVQHWFHWCNCTIEVWPRSDYETMRNELMNNKQFYYDNGLCIICFTEIQQIKPKAFKPAY